MFELWIFAGMFVFDALIVGVLVAAALVQENRHRPPKPARIEALIPWPSSRMVDTDRDALMQRDIDRRNGNWN